ncbi:TrmH family RNA methyltransferase [Micromonospora sp. SD19]
MEAATIASETREPATVQAIDSTRHPVVRRIADVLRNRSERPSIFVLDDLENIEQAIACGVEVDTLYLSASADPSTFAGIDADVPRYVLDDSVARTLFGEQKRSRAFALARAPRRPRLRDLIGTTGDIIILDGVRIVGNIGAITRTACALAAAGIVLVDSGLRTIWDRRLIRASRGLVFATPVVLATRAECAEFIRQEGLVLAALSADAVEPLSSIRTARERLALAMGSEREGVSRELDALTTYRYSIPMASNVESLNVSVTAGIALFEHRTGEHQDSRLREVGGRL